MADVETLTSDRAPIHVAPISETYAITDSETPTPEP
jgi:hypothetical protein